MYTHICADDKLHRNMYRHHSYGRGSCALGEEEGCVYFDGHGLFSFLMIERDGLSESSCCCWPLRAPKEYDAIQHIQQSGTLCAIVDLADCRVTFASWECFATFIECKDDERPTAPSCDTRQNCHSRHISVFHLLLKESSSLIIIMH